MGCWGAREGWIILNILEGFFLPLEMTSSLFTSQFITIYHDFYRTLFVGT